jgi:hypothetical protein
MKPLSKSESAMQNDQAIETRRVGRSIANREWELNLRSLDSLSIPTGVSRSNANVPTEQSDYSRLEVLTVWVPIAVVVVLSCGSFYVLWSKASGGWYPT